MLASRKQKENWPQTLTNSVINYVSKGTEILTDSRHLDPRVMLAGVE